MDISGFACQGIRCIYHTARVLGYGAKPAPNQINRQNRKYIHKNYYLPEAGHYIVPILVKPLYTIICKLIQVLVLPLYIKTIIGSYFYLFFQSLRRVLRARRQLVLDLDDSQKRGFARQDEYRCAHSSPNPLGGKSDAKPPHASFTNNLYAST